METVSFVINKKEMTFIKNGDRLELPVLASPINSEEKHIGRHMSKIIKFLVIRRG